MEPKDLQQTRLEQILDEWDIDNTLSPVGTNSITFSSSSNTVSMTSPCVVTGVGTDLYSISSNSPSNSAKINLSGKDADIEVNGWSLVAAVKRIEERLDLFQPNPELEAEWLELRDLGEQYRRLEQQIKDKQSTWDRLKAMPAPDKD
jgi:hypothetical protein